MSKDTEDKNKEVKTYLFEQVDGIKGYSFNEKISFVASEIIHNAKSYGATKMFIGRFKSSNKDTYMVLASDATPFESVDTLKLCLEPNTSHGGRGVQGSGMKLSMFQLKGEKEDAEDAELIVHNKLTGGNFTVRSQVYDQNKANIFSDDNMGLEIKEAFSLNKIYKDYNVFVLYKTKKAILDKMMVYAENNRSYFGGVDLINYLMPNRNIEIKFDEKKGDASQDKDGSYVSRDKKDRGARSNVKLIEPKEIEDFIIDHEDFNFKNLKICFDGKNEVYLDGRMRMNIFPNFKTKKHIQIINLRTGQNENSVDKFLPVISIGFDPSKFDSLDENLNRLLEDSFYIGSAPSPIYNNMNLSYVSKNYTSKIGEYEYLSSLKENGLVLGDDINSWSPEMQSRIEITRISYEDIHKNRKDISDIKDCLKYIPTLNAFFKCQNRQDGFNLCKDIATNIFENSSDQLNEFRKRFEKHFPYDREEGLPIRSFEQEHKNSKIVDAYDKGGNKIRKIPIKTTLDDISLKVRGDETKVTGDIDVIGKSGQKTTQLILTWDDHDNVYSIRVNSNPNKTNFLKFNEEIYRLGFICDIDKMFDRGDDGKKGRGNSKGDIDSEYTYGYYIAEPEKYYFVQYVDSYTKINRNNKLFEAIIKCDSIDRPTLQKEWDEVYREINRRVTALHNLYKDQVSCISNKRDNNEWEQYGKDGLTSAINMALRATYLNESLSNEFSKLYKKVNK